MDFNAWVRKQNKDFFSTHPFINDVKEKIFAYAEDVHYERMSEFCAGAISNVAYRISIYKKKNKTVMQIINMKKERRGIAICREGDIFDPQVGIAYAWARYKKEEIPDFVVLTKLKDMKNGQRFVLNGEEKFFVGMCRDPHEFAYMDSKQIIRIGCSLNEDYLFKVII